MMDNSENYIENKVKIAVDSSKVLAAYLDEVALEFIKQGVPEAYSITSELENTIIENLKALGKTTKIGTDEVLNEINKIGKPKRLVESYIEIHQDELELQPVDFGNKKINRPAERKYYIPTVSEKLVKREGTIEEGLKQMSGWIAMIIPSLFLIFAISSMIDQDISSVQILLIYFVLANLIIELWSGLSGTLYTRVEVLKFIRSTNKNIMWMLTLMIFSIDLMRMNLSNDYSSDGRFSDTFNLLILLVIMEITYFTRDHLDGLYPLEPDFKPALRILLFPNILIILGLLLFFTNISFYPTTSFWFVPNLWFAWILMATGLIKGIETKTPPTNRLVILTLLPSFFLVFLFGLVDFYEFFGYAGGTYRSNFPTMGMIWFGIFLLYLFERYGKKVIEKAKEAATT